MSLLDALKDPTMQRGLLELGLRLMSTPGKFGQALGQSGLGAMQGVAQFKSQQFQEEMRKQQLAQMEREKRLQGQQDTLSALPGQYIRPATAEALGNNPSAYMPAQPEQMDYEGLIKAYMSAPGGFEKGLGLQDRLRKQGPTAHTVGAGGKLVFTDQAGNVVRSIDNPAVDKDKESPLARLIEEQAKYPVGSPQWRRYELAIEKTSTHQPGVNVSYGAPVAGVDPKTNEPVFFQPGRTGGPPSIVQGVVPPDKTKDPTEFQAKAGLYFTSMKNASEVLNRLETSKRTDWMPTVQEEAAPERLKNFARSAARQSYVQGQRQWIDSINRVRSGANLPEIEYDRAVKTFFPSFGETSPDVIAQKRDMRAKEETAMREAAGRALQKPSASPDRVRRYNPETGKIE